MNIDATASSAYAQLLSQSSQGKAGPASDFWADFSLSMIDISVSGAEEVTRPQTVDDVKKEFYSYLDSLNLAPGLSGAGISVNITDAAFEKMLADPEYKQKMKDLCARDLCDPNWSKNVAMGIAPSALVITIDADCEEEYLASSYNHPDYRSKADGDSFWSRRTNKRNDDAKAEEKRAREKRDLRDLLEERALERKELYRELEHFPKHREML